MNLILKRQKIKYTTFFNDNFIIFKHDLYKIMNKFKN